MNRSWVALGLVAAAVVVATYGGRAAPPRPVPPSPGPSGLSLVFAGPTATEDAVTLAALAAEYADVLEADGKLDKPRLATGAQFDALRVIARDMRCRGAKIGDRQPRVRDDVERFLTDRLGTSGGPVTPEQRAAWVDAYRTIAEACRASR